MNTIHRCLALLLPVAIVCFVSQSIEVSPQKVEESVPTSIAPTEASWNRLMQLVYGPSFNNLKKQIGSEAKKGEVDLVAVQKDALILAEFTSRLHDWPEIHKFDSEEAKTKYLESHKMLETEEVAEHAASIYNAAKEGQLDVAKESFIAMTNSCNICHTHRKSRWAPVTLEH